MPVIALRTLCSSLAPANNLACAYGGGAYSAAQLTADVAPGTYFLWIDGEGGTAGAFRLDLLLEPTTTTETCASPTPLVFAGGKVDLNADTRSHTDDAAGNCGGAGAPDSVYTFTLTEPHSVQIEVDPSSTFAPVVYLRQGTCMDTSSASQLWCATGTAGQTVTTILPALAAGTYFLFVDGATATGDSSAGPFHLKVTLLDAVPPPPNDTCAGAIELMFPASGLGTVDVQGDTSNAQSDSLGCSGTGPDVVYSLNLIAPRQVGIHVTPQSGSQLRPVVYLRQPNACASEELQDQLGCAEAAQQGASVTLDSPSLPAGLYYLWVDGAQGTAGAFDLNVELAAPPPPPANDMCPGAITLALASGPVTVTGTTVSAGDDAHLSCTIPSGAFSPDVVYTIVLPTEQALAIDLTASAGSQLRPIFALRDQASCGSNSLNDELACAWDDSQTIQRTVLTLPDVPAGTYALWVEGDSSTQGDFSLRVSASTPAVEPTNDWCGDTTVPAIGTSPRSGDTRAAFNDDEGECGFEFGSNGEEAPDVVYKLNVTTQQSVTITVTPDALTGALFRPVVYVRAPNQCSSVLLSPTPVCCQVATEYGQPVSLTMPYLAAGVYSVWVDGAGLSSGSFAIRLQ